MRFLLAVAAFFWLITLWGLAHALRGPGVLRRVRGLINTLVRLAVALALSSIVILLHFFQLFSQETLVARVNAKRLADFRFLVTYAPVDGTPALQAELAGDQYAISGGIVKWHPLLLGIGKKSYHRPMRLSGQFSDLERQRTHFPSVYPLQPQLLDRFWEAFYWMDPYLPFVDAVYGSSAYAYLEPELTQEVYVSNSGYLIKRGKKL